MEQNLTSPTVQTAAEAPSETARMRSAYNRGGLGLAALYGVMQAAIKASSYDDPVAHAHQLLKENGLKTTISLTALGNLKLITGNTVAVQEPITNTHGLFWIVSDTHTWKNGVYQTKLSLSLEAIMDSQTAGSLPTE